jgi:hypothetical protein
MMVSRPVVEMSSRWSIPQSVRWL